MKYAYFPGCSAKSGGRAYEESFLAVCEALDLQMEELDDWNCCGATSFMSVDEGEAYALTVRNLALAEKTGLEMVAPCGGCYGILLKAHHYYEQYPAVRQAVDKGLHQDGLEYKASTKIKHPLDLLSLDVGPKEIRKKVKRPLKGLKVACYYGCRFVRPIAPFDDQHNPTTMDNLLKGVGARIADYGLKGACCGGALTGTLPQAAMHLTYMLLREANRQEADVIATACPLCQFNLEAYQDDVRRDHPEIKPVPVVYFTQLLGIALGIENDKLGLRRQIVPIEPVLRAKGILAEEPAGVK